MKSRSTKIPSEYKNSLTEAASLCQSKELLPRHKLPTAPALTLKVAVQPTSVKMKHRKTRPQTAQTSQTNQTAILVMKQSIKNDANDALGQLAKDIFRHAQSRINDLVQVRQMTCQNVLPS
jgi:hypothetical protein